jgi:hypothetical protein
MGQVPFHSNWIWVEARSGAGPCVLVVKQIKVDEDVLQDVVCLGFDRTQLAESLVNHAQNKVLMNYWVWFPQTF